MPIPQEADLALHLLSVELSLPMQAVEAVVAVQRRMVVQVVADSLTQLAAVLVKTALATQVEAVAVGVMAL